MLSHVLAASLWVKPQPRIHVGVTSSHDRRSVLVHLFGKAVISNLFYYYCLFNLIQFKHSTEKERKKKPNQGARFSTDKANTSTAGDKPPIITIADMR